MSTPTGFMEYQRQLPADRSPAERVKDWEEFHKHLEEDELQTQEHAAWTAVRHTAIQESI